MRRVRNLFTLLMGLSLLVGCSTQDVDFDLDGQAEANLYPLSDVAFAEYLIYNTTLEPSNRNMLPYGICISRNDSFLLDVDKAKQVKALYLVKDSKRVEELTAAGVASAAVKIANLDGVQYFNNCTNLRLTSNSVEGKLDLSSLTKLDTLEMNANLVNQLIVPSSIKRLRYSASSSANETQRLSAVDLSQASRAEHIFITNHFITKEGLELPTSYSKLVDLDLSGNSGADFPIPQAMYDQLSTKKGVEVSTDVPSQPNYFLLSDVAFAEYLIYNTTLAETSSNRLPFGICINRNDSFLLDTDMAKHVKALYLVKDSKRVEELTAAGVASAAVKIANVDGVQYFTECTNLRLTSNSVEGSLDLSALTKLDTLEMNANLVNELVIPSSIKRLRYSASSNANEMQRLTALNLSAASRAEHIFVTNHLITQESLELPTRYINLVDLDLSGNSGADFPIPQAMYDQLSTKKGVEPKDDNGGEVPSDEEYLVRDLAFGDYLLYLMNDVEDASLRLPEGIVVKKENGIYINIEVANSFDGTLNIIKSSAAIKRLQEAGVATADVKIADADGLQHFISLREFVATSNAFKQPLPLENLRELTSLIVRTAGLSELDLSSNTKLTYLDIQGSTSSSLGRLQAVDLSKNINLNYVNLSANNIVPADFILPSSYNNLKTLNMGKNKVGSVEVSFVVPADLFDQLGSESSDKAGLVRGE
ncbi:MAG: hypothetical protein ACRCZM_06990 [Bacteroidales bacterium]